MNLSPKVKPVKTLFKILLDDFFPLQLFFSVNIFIDWDKNNYVNIRASCIF